MAEKATPSAQPDLRGLAERLRLLAGWFDRGAESPVGPCAAIADDLRAAAALAVPEDGARSEWRPIGYVSEGTLFKIRSAPLDINGLRYTQEITVWAQPTAPDMTIPLYAPVAAARPSGEQEGESK